VTDRTAVTIEVGDTLGPMVKKPSMISLFRFSAATWNAHRLHYDNEFAKQEGAERPLAQAYLLGAYLAQLAQDWAGPSARLVKLSYRARRPVSVDDEVACSGSVSGKEGQLVDVELRLERGGEVCMTGTAQLLFP
jgi:hydroxyacyl-ACP dehydratase HTD2-like protein with hotdog domain